MPKRTILIAKLIVILLCATGCTLFAGEQAPKQVQEKSAAKTSSDTEELLHQHQTLAAQHAALQVRRTRLLNDYNDFDAPARLGRLDRALESLNDQQAEVLTRLQHRGLLRNNLRYAVPPPTLVIVATPEQMPPEQRVQTEPATAPKQPLDAATAPKQPEAAAETSRQETPAPAPRAAASASATKVASATAPATLTGISWAEDGPALSVRIATSVSSPRFKTFTLADPARIVVDIAAMQRPEPLTLHLAPASPHARGIRMGWHPERSFIRVVIDCNGPVPPHSTLATPQGITVQLTP